MENLEKLSRTLEYFLPNALMDAQSRLQKLTSPRLANSLTHDAASLFVEDFVLVEGAIRNHIELSQTVFPRSAQEVRLLLGF
jgi:Conserved oligomeric complex COG6